MKRLLCVAALALSSSVQSATLTVTNGTVDDNVTAGTLRVVVAGAASGDTINFAPGVTNVSLSFMSTGITIASKSLSFDGGGAGVTITQTAASPIFTITSGAADTIAFDRITFTGGTRALAGTGIVLTVSDCTFKGHAAPGNSVVANTGAATDNFQRCTFSNNSGARVLSVLGTTVLTNCTFSGNTTTVTTIDAAQTLTLASCTVVNNSGATCGGISTATSLTVTNSIVAGNTAPAGNPADLLATAGTVSRSGRNIIGNPDLGGAAVTAAFPTGRPNGSGDLVGDTATPVDPLVNPLADNGGPTRTHALQAASSAIGFAVGAPGVDQRGVARPQGAAADVGAYEVAATTTTLMSSANPALTGQSVTYTATIGGPANNRALGSVQFSIGGTAFGAPVTVVNGTATLTTSFASIGARAIDAAYTGSNSLNSSAATLTQNVNIAATTTALSSSANPASTSLPVTFTATVTPVAPAGGVPTGTVQFVVDGANFGAAVPLAAGVARSAATSNLSIGTHAVSAVYSGDANYTASNVALTQTTTNGAPVIVSAIASPPLQGIRLPILFTLAATDVDNDPLTITWDFGDGTTGSGANVSHEYGATGVFTVRVTINDGKVPPVTTTLNVTIVTTAEGGAADADRDGFTDEIELAAGSSPVSTSSTPFGGAPAGAPVPFDLSGGLKITLKFTQGGADMISLSGSLPVSSATGVGESRIVIGIGGVVHAVTVNARGQGAADSSSGKFSVKLTGSKALGAIQNVRLQAKFKGDAKSKLADEGLREENVSKAVQVPVTILYNNTFFYSVRTLTYTAKVGGVGTAK